MPSSNSATPRVREHFRAKAFSFDRLYEEDNAVQRTLRPGLFLRRELARQVAREYENPSVLDVGGGSGRVGEWLLEDGVSRYVDIDLSDTMLDLARERLARFGDKVELVQGDFLTTPLEGSFDVALTLGYFDYIEDAPAHLKRISEVLAPGGSVVASFPRWTWTKGPIRKVRYELINNCPIFDYDEPGLHRIFGEAGLPRLDVRRGKSGFLIRARAAA